MDILLAVWILGAACQLMAWMLAIGVFKMRVYREHGWTLTGILLCALVLSWLGFIILMYFCLEEVYRDVEGV